MDEKYQWLTPAQASERLCVHPETLRQRSDELPKGCVAATPGGHRRYRADLLHELPASRPLEAKPSWWDAKWSAIAKGQATVMLPATLKNGESTVRLVMHSLSPAQLAAQVSGELVQFTRVNAVPARVLKPADKAFWDVISEIAPVLAARHESSRSRVPEHVHSQPTTLWRASWTCMVFGEFQLKADDRQSACKEVRARAAWHSARSRYGFIVEDVVQVAPGEIAPASVVWPESDRVAQMAEIRSKAQAAWPDGVGSRSEYQKWDDEQLDGLARSMVGPADSLASLLGTRILAGVRQS